MFRKGIFVFLAVYLLAGAGQLFAQTDKQRRLEEQRRQLQKEIKQARVLLSTNQRKTRSLVSEAEDIQAKISIQERLIRVTNQQANLLARQIDVNQKQIGRLRNELKQLKEDYADMVVNAYKSKSQQNRIMFLLSSQNFLQAYKRVQYMKQYASYRKKQGDAIQEKTLTLQELNTALIAQRQEKEKLVAENRLARKELAEEKKRQDEMIANLKQQQGKYAAEIQRKQREEKRINREINRLIREAIAASNKKSGKANTSSTRFSLTPETKRLADNFTANKGKLPWPVSEGVVVLGFGKQPSPLNRSSTIQSNGVRIATSKNTKARAVFDGEVSRIVSSKNSNPMVMIRHGNYITIYRNLSRIYVKAGQKVTAKQEIGEVFTNPEGKTVLQFSIFKNITAINPAEWVYRM